MITSRHFVFGIGCLIMCCGTAWSVPPWQTVASAGHDSLRGCRWRRCVKVVRQMPRAEEAVRLQPQLHQGPAFFKEITTETKQDMTVMGQQVRQTQTQVFVLEWTPLGKNDGGHAVLRMKIIGVKMKIDVGGVNISYDSTESNQPSNPMTEFFKQVLDAEFKFVIDLRKLTVKAMDGHVELIKKVGPMNPQMEPLLKSLLSQEALAQLATPLFAFLPASPVRRGDSWNSQSALDYGPIGTYRSETRYTYDGKSGPHDKIRAQSTLKYDAPKNSTGLPFTIKKSDLKSTSGGGEILFDSARGRLVSSELQLRLEGNLTIEVGGMETEVGLAQTQRQRVRVSDTNPLPPRKD